METERRSPLKIIDRGRSSVESNRVKSFVLAPESRDSWEDAIRNEISRVHALIDKVNCEADQMLSDDSMRAIKILEKNAELRELQAYQKGLRFAIDRQKEISRSSRRF